MKLYKNHLIIGKYTIMFNWLKTALCIEDNGYYNFYRLF